LQGILTKLYGMNLTLLALERAKDKLLGNR
jgi:hypothetical protein